jgi:hypothetical protein
MLIIVKDDLPVLLCATAASRADHIIHVESLHIGKTGGDMLQPPVDLLLARIIDS